MVAKAPGQHESAQNELRQLDGIERVGLLPIARMIAVCAGLPDNDPAYVFIEWEPTVVETPYPGSAVWRAVLEQLLRTSGDEEPSFRSIRHALQVDLERFPSLEEWLHWRDHGRSKDGLAHLSE
jgi:hypothetical protein